MPSMEKQRELFGGRVSSWLVRCDCGRELQPQITFGEAHVIGCPTCGNVMLARYDRGEISNMPSGIRGSSTSLLITDEV